MCKGMVVGKESRMFIPLLVPFEKTLSSMEELSAVPNGLKLVLEQVRMLY